MQQETENKGKFEPMSSVAKLTEEQLNRLNAACKDGKPVPADIRVLVITHYGFDGTEPEEVIAEAARNIGVSIHDIFRETLARQGMGTDVVFDHLSQLKNIQ